MGRNQGSKPKAGAKPAGRKTNAERAKAKAAEAKQAATLARMMGKSQPSQPPSKRPRVSEDQTGEGSSAGARSASSAGDVDVAGGSSNIGESAPPPAGAQPQPPPALDDEGAHSQVDKE
ncbi:unnamed protein product, partial [Ectocarpus sp. 4 AP-2014]